MLGWVKGLFAAASFLSPSHDGGQVSRPSLLGLPQELLDNIVDFLDDPDAACLSVCSKDLYRRLGVNRWQLLRLDHGHERQRNEFLARLGRDNPNLFFCHTCSYIHLVARVGPAIIGREHLPCIRSHSSRDIPTQSFEIYGSILHYRLTSLHVQLAMARHRNGPKYGISMSSLSFTEIKWRKMYKVWTLLSVEPRIIDNELFLRVQHWIAFDQDDQPTFERTRGPSICSHINKYAGKYEGKDTGYTTIDLLQCQIQHVGGRASCPTCSALYRCIDCAVEFESDAIHLEDRKVAVIITKWLNLGNGDSPTNPNWRRHLYPPFEGLPVVTARDSLGPRSIFEGHMGRTQETATRESASLFCGEAFRKKLRQIATDVWRDHF